MKPAHLIGCQNVSEFFDRFGATPAQRTKYVPLFLAIMNSNGGECAPSFGLFEKNKLLYTQAPPKPC